MPQNFVANLCVSPAVPQSVVAARCLRREMRCCSMSRLRVSHKRGVAEYSSFDCAKIRADAWQTASVCTHLGVCVFESARRCFGGRSSSGSGPLAQIYETHVFRVFFRGRCVGLGIVWATVLGRPRQMLSLSCICRILVSSHACVCNNKCPLCGKFSGIVRKPFAMSRR